MGVFGGNTAAFAQKSSRRTGSKQAKIPKTPDPDQNDFGVKSRRPLGEWGRKGRIIGPDPRGWIQWYCRFFLARRQDDIDAKRSPAGAHRASRRPDQGQLRVEGPVLQAPQKTSVAAKVIRRAHLTFQARRFGKSLGQLQARLDEPAVVLRADGAL